MTPRGIETYAARTIPLRHMGRVLSAIERAEADHGITVSVSPWLAPHDTAPHGVIVAGQRRVGGRLQQCRLVVSNDAIRHARGNAVAVTIAQVVRRMRDADPEPQWPTRD